MKALIPWLLLAVMGIILWCRAPLQRPFEGDEIFSLRRFASLPYEQNYEAVKKLGRFQVSGALHGVAKFFLNGYDNSSHVLSMIPGTLSAFFLGYSEVAFRMPAVFAGMFVCLGLFWLCYWESGSRTLGFVMAALLMSSPYLYHYAQTARGYAGAIALVLVQIWLVETATRRNQIRTCSLLAITSLLMCMNLLTAAIMWLIPLFVVLLLWGKKHPGDVTELGLDKIDWLWAAVCAATPCAVFGMCHMHDLIIAQAKWGEIWRTRSDLLALLGQTWTYLIPNSWIPLVIGASAGIVLGIARGNWLSRVILVSVLVTVGYLIAGHKVPYPRTFGQFLIYIPIGLACLWCKSGGGAGRRLIIGIAWALCGWAAVVAALGAWDDVRKPLLPEYTDAAVLVQGDITSRHETKENALVLPPFDQGEQMRYYLPADVGYMSAAVPRPNSFSLYLISSKVKNEEGVITETVARSGNAYGYWNVKIPPKQNQTLPGIAVARYDVDEVEGYGGWHGMPFIVSCSIMDPYFDIRRYLDVEGRKYCGDGVLNLNLDDYSPVKTVVFFVKSPTQAAAAGLLLENLQSRTRCLILTIRFVQSGK